jgi:hypothetical protein
MGKCNGLITAEQTVPSDDRSTQNCVIKANEAVRFADLQLHQHQNNLHTKE